MARKRNKTRKDRIKRGLKFELYGIIILALSVISMASLGPVGRAFTFLFRIFLGTWDFVIPLCGVFIAVYVMVKHEWPKRWTARHTGFALLLLTVLVFLHHSLFQTIAIENPEGKESIIRTTMHRLMEEVNAGQPTDIGGGLVGAISYAFLKYLFDDLGTKIVMVVLTLIGLLLLTGISYVQLVHTLRLGLKKLKSFAFARLNRLWDAIQRRRYEKKAVSTRSPRDSRGPSADDGQSANDRPVIHDYTERQVPVREQVKPDTPPDRANLQKDADFVGSKADEKKLRSYKYPTLDLLDQPKQTKGTDSHKGMAANAKKLEQTLESFGVRARVTHIHRGPAVTRYEVEPDIGVKVSRIVNLSDDLALALAAKDIRIEAPIPGKGAIGIEVPNGEVAVVSLRDVLESPEFKEAPSQLTLALGRDVSGDSVVGDLSKMPHLLVAGATGSGKSVCINAFIASVLFKAKPNEVKFLMIDPKMVELNVYNGIPHLLTPVVTDPRRAALALKKVVSEMEKRYELFAECGARDISRYNELMAERNPDQVYPAMPYIVVIVDELADLMMVAPHDVEDAILRLAQMARAAGIHLIIATQRPSVDVITGVIKANIPSRIAFGVSSQADSRTILDMGGAEKLMGRGDMLYLPVGASKPVRIQGAFLSDREVERIVSFCKNQQDANYNEEMMVKSEELKSEGAEVEDELYPQAVKLVVETKTASVSLLQRRLRIGYTRAARLIDEMEARGIVGPYEGSKPREVLVTPEQLRGNEQIPS